MKQGSWRAAVAVLGLVWGCAGMAQDSVLPEGARSGGPYVPTPNTIIDQMLGMANVGARDFVIDLGSGDGIIVLTAAHRLKASGYGVDIDPALVKLSNDRARNLGIADRAKFEVVDVFKADVSRATVVTLYLLPDMMRRLRGKLFAELRPGTRVVSHDYHFDEWPHDGEISFDAPEKEAITGVPRATVYLWVVPAKVAGNWRLQVEGDGDYDLALKQRYQSWEGVATAPARKGAVLDPELRGADISFALLNGVNRIGFSGKVDGDQMEGRADLGGGRMVKWRAKRQP